MCDDTRNDLKKNKNSQNVINRLVISLCLMWMQYA